MVILSAFALAVDATLAPWPTIQAPVGAQQTFLVRQLFEQREVERSGLFLLLPSSSVYSSERAMLVTYTLLAPTEQGDPRVQIDARYVHPESLRPIVDAPLSEVFVLTPGQAVPEAEDVDPALEAMANLFTPGYTLADALPMQVGEVRAVQVDTPRIPPVDAWGQIELVADSATLRFEGWETMEGLGSPAALLRDEVVLTGEGSSSEPTSLIHLEAEILREARLVPDDFPFSLESVAEGEIVFKMGSEEYPGAIRTHFRYSISADRVAGTVTGAVYSMESGDVIGGRWADATWDLGDGMPAILYSFKGHRGDRIQVTLKSQEFDAYLFVLDKAWQAIAEEAWGGKDVSLQTELPEQGEYIVVVTADDPEAAGQYTLAVESLGRSVDEDAMRQIVADAVGRLEEAVERADWVGVLATLDESVRAARLQLPLTVERPTLVTDRPSGYGEYVERSTNVYRSGETVHIYLEPKNFHTREREGRSEIYLTVDAVLVDATGAAVATLPDVVVWNRLTAHPVAEVYVSVPLWVAGVKPGGYSWRLTVRDRVSEQSATVEVPIVITSTDSAL